MVTGGASGLGEGTARAIAATGAKVALFDHERREGARPLPKEIGGVFCQVDVTDDASVAAAFEKARTAHGQERLTVNCAGIATGHEDRLAQEGHRRDQAPTTWPQFERTVRVNLFGTFRVLSQSAAGMVTLEPMADGERGLIVNTASVAAQDGQIGQAAYSASKGGVYAMTLPIARDLAQEGIRCNTILPGIMWTPMMAGMDQKIQDALAAAIPFPSRLGTPADYASLVLELVRNVYINGECIRLDGAIRLAPR